ncbi:MAG: arginine--tRNA ligase [Alphaproteobacteria bacterium]|nr:arginine--tRNA ligase [Alphaproteobacteria bacterium]
MNLYSHYRTHVLNTVNALIANGDIPQGLSVDAITVEPPRDTAHGDFATNAAMVLAGQAKQKPRDIADKIAASLRIVEGITSVEVAGPGFINLRIDSSHFTRLVDAILKQGTGYGTSTIGQSERVNVEYVSANPTGPLHVGHARGAVVGDALANLMQKAGYQVTKEYYINDAGAQIGKVARSAYLRYREACGEAIGEMPEGLYPGEYMKEAGEAIKAVHGTALLDAPEETWLPLCQSIAIECMLSLIKADLKDLGITHDVFTSEAALHAAHKIEEAIAQLERDNLVYRGVLEPPKGKKPEDWEPREQLLFRSTDHGDDVDRPLQKSDGIFTYFAADLALASDKHNRGFTNQILVLGADHGGYVKRLQAAVSALSGGKSRCDVLLCQLVHLFQNGEPFKMSKRAGNFIAVRDVLEAVGKDILRFIMLTRKSDMVMEFDLDKVKEQSKENPVFYVQYAHARTHSLMRLASADAASALEASKAPTASDLDRLKHPAELAVLRKLAQWPRIVEQAALAREPHRIPFYLHELAAEFHGFWNLGQSDAGMRFIVKEDAQLTTARLALARALALVIASGLEICGVTPAEELRG